LEITVRINDRIVKVKNRSGRITGHQGAFGDLKTVTFATTKAAESNLLEMIEGRCTYASARVHVVSVRGHVGIFSRTLDGGVYLQHAWPDGHVGSSSGPGELDGYRDAEASFRLHVAQITWDSGRVETCDILPEFKQQEFRDWVEWQLRYKHAHETLNMSETESHRWACENKSTEVVAA
jgi:hypothetical protein